MVYKSACRHLLTATSIPIETIINSKEKIVCSDCDCPGPNLWICLEKNCLRIGCSENFNDHSTIHNEAEPTHCVHMNLSSYRLWCYECKSEVFLNSPPVLTAYNDSDQEAESAKFRSHDSGHGSYSTLRTNTPDHGNVFAFEDNVNSSNVGMSAGDTSESSDGEDSSECNVSKPIGLVGLQNIGNTCYMNAALQALSNTVPLTNFFLECEGTVKILSEGRKPGLSRTYQLLMREIWITKNGGSVTPSGILCGIRSVHAMFRGYHQHDTQEFLRNFMDQLHEELKQLQTPEQNAINDSDTFCMAMDEPALSSSYDSSEGEYETCDSGVSERSSLSDDNERPHGSSKRRLSRSSSPGRRLRARLQSSGVVDSQPSPNTQNAPQMNKKQVKYRSIISDIFDGKLLSSVQCLTCDRVSSRVETFQDLSLPIPSRDHLLVLHGRTSGTSTATCSESVLPVEDGWLTWILAWLKSWFYGPTVTLHDCLAAFFSTDELKGDNMYSCEKCNKLRNGIKFSKVLQLPEILCIHLKRFRHELMFSSKISSPVSFPLKGLEMKPYLHSDCVSKVTNYELFSVICHHGTAGGGHYICYALNGNQWYEFDDEYITKVSSEKVQSCEAYVLFYRKINSTADKIRSEAVSLQNRQMESRQEVAYVSRQWLSRFSTCAEPGPIDNTDFLCLHGSIHPERAMHLELLAVPLPLEMYNFLYSKFGGCPAITTIVVCQHCQALHKKIIVERETFLQLSREAQELNLPPTHLLSTSWFSLWHGFIQRRITDPPGPIDNSKITINISDGGADCAEISESIWIFFYKIYGGGPELRIQPEILKRSDSDASLQSELDETLKFENEEEVKNSNRSEGSYLQAEVGNNNVQACSNSTSKKQAPKDEKIDQTVYSHGEPMETDVIKENGFMESVDEIVSEEVPMEVCETKVDVKCNENSSNISENIPDNVKPAKADSNKIVNSTKIDLRWKKRLPRDHS